MTHRITDVSDPTQHAMLLEALPSLERAVERFGHRRMELLAKRTERQREFNRGALPGFRADTRQIRHGDWRVEPVPEELRDRRVEITGPVDRKMIINALNSGAKVFMADFEDSTSPTWENVLAGQKNLYDAVRRTIHFTSEAGKQYRLKDNPAVLFVRPRGLHLWENHVVLDGLPVPASLFDFCLYYFHNAIELKNRGSAPYFYLPKLECAEEAQWWNDVFAFAESEFGMPEGSTKATVLIETLPAAFEMHEILHALRTRSAGLNCGRWDYIFSFIKTFRNDPTKMLPDRAQVSMDRAFLRAYSQLLIDTCHRRGAHAMGGMAAQIPIKSDPEKNAVAIGKVRADKEREARMGHDGTWVAHPGLVPIALEVFDKYMSKPNQTERPPSGEGITEAKLIEVPKGTQTRAGLEQNVRVGLVYVESWLRGQGCVPIDHLMEDAATAEISRTQLWQWIRHGAELQDGTKVTHDLVEGLIRDTCDSLASESAEGHRFEEAGKIFAQLCLGETLPPFLTLPAYELITRRPTTQDTAVAEEVVERATH